MPTYEYLCRDCSHRFETWQKMIDDPLTICPECGGHIRRVFFPAGIVFKGSGFYKTDHSSNPTASQNGHKKSEQGESGKGSEATTTSESTSTGSSAESSSPKPTENKIPAETK
jgi:putative FmdB family regulatory protein